MYLIRREDAPVFNMPGLTVAGFASPSRGAAQVSTWRLELAPGSEGVEHSVDREEIFMALSGNALARLGGEEVELRPGDALIVPPGIAFSLGNPGATAFSAIAVAPVGVRARIAEGASFSPPWTE